MNYIWTEDTGAGLHYWQMVNEYLLGNQFRVESKGSNQGILDAARELHPEEYDRYYLAFDIVYDNMDVMNKYLELRELSKKRPQQIIILDMICFEYIILCFRKLVEWTGTGKRNKILMREKILASVREHKIEIERIEDPKMRDYLMGFKHYSTERGIKAIAYELTENDKWSVKGDRMGDCWHQDCCVADNPGKVSCNVDRGMAGKNKIMQFLTDAETQRIINIIS